MAKQASEPKGLKKLLEDQLQDLYYVEKQLVKALPKMVKAAQNEDLSQGFADHLEETKGQVARLEQVFEAMGKPAKAKKCPAIDGILEECTELMDEFKGEPGIDAGLIDGGQKVEHYEIATYGSCAAWAVQLGLDEVADLLHETLEEEKAADEKLTEVSEAVNAEAMEGEEGDEEEKGDSKGKGKKMPMKMANGKATARKSAPKQKATAKR
ncbi:MAG TPA: ferritin-like domain-containing protein [Flavobacteriales bacterium]|jgi:ferritin-like metal-binding protein YciE|nr:ferritin-like domain-containing protein [Flavobacteriales bacterium]